VRLASVGGGPGGLFFSILTKKADPSREVVVYERNAPDATFGFGVVFSDRTLDNLEDADAETYGALTAAGARWTDIEVRHKGRSIRCGGNGFSAIARKQLLLILQERARELGVDLRFESEVPNVGDLAGDYDLVVAADGVNSRTREAHKDHFRPQVSEGTAKYAWFGTAQQFDALTFLFVETEHGRFSVHAYPSDGQTSTFIVETDEASWRRAGLDAVDAASLAPGESDEVARAYCQEIFADHLGGHSLLVNNSKWLNFRTVTNAAWSHGNVALLGDAAHTAHFSVGSGTKMAMEDAISLAESVDELGATPQALNRYEGQRRPAVERIQAAARPSQAWWEAFGRHMRLPPERFVYHFLTRNPRLTHEGLKVRDYRFVRGVEAWFERRAAPRPGDEGVRPASPLSMPLGLRGVVLPNRVSTAPPASAPEGGTAEEGRDVRLARVAGAALWGAGLVAVSGSELADEADVREWRDLSELVHHRSRASLGLLVEAAEPEEAAEAARRADGAGFDVLELLDTGGLPWEILRGEQTDRHAQWALAAVAQVREVWPKEKPVVVHLEVPEDAAGREAAVEFARKLKERGCDAVGVSLTGLDGDWERRIAQLDVSDRIRNEAGLATMLVGGVPGDDEAVTAVLSGRADLCRGRPSLSSPIWERGEATGQASGKEPLAVAGEADGSAPS